MYLFTRENMALWVTTGFREEGGKETLQPRIVVGDDANERRLHRRSWSRAAAARLVKLTQLRTSNDMEKSVDFDEEEDEW